MKKLSTTLFLIVLLLVCTTGAMAQNSKTFTLSPSAGSYNQTGWCSNWTSNSSDYPVTKISVAGGINNMNASTTSGGFEMAVGTNANSNYTWNLSVPGYKIESYSFKFKSKNNGQNINVVAGGQTLTSSYSTEKTLTVNNVNAQVASFQLTGNNYAIIVSELTFIVHPILEAGQVYMFKNARADRSLSADGTDDVHTMATDVNDTKQQWYVTKDGDYYILRNLATAKYLKGNGQSSAWSMTDDYSHDYNKFELCLSNTTYNTLHTKALGDYAYMHDSNNDDNGGYNVVGWQNGDTNTGSHWVITKVEYTEEQIKALLDAAPTAAEVAAYSTSLKVLFTDGDGACLTPAMSSLSEAKVSEAYSKLPAVLQKMVDKVYSQTWEEKTVSLEERPNGNNNTNHSLWTVADTWNSDYAKKFRVQMYEPYSIENEVTSYLRINAHCNMDNPTGIYANNGDVIYIMVDGDIAEGAELWLAYQSGNGATRYYNESPNVQLHKGLNRVTFTADGCQMWINYLVHTYNSDGATVAEKFPHKLSDYKPLKIHIEGGHINGFFNAMGDFRAADSGTENLWGDVDNDDDWDYYKARVALPTDFALLGHRQTLLFPFGAYDSEKGYFGVANADGGIEKALAYHLENIEVASTPNCYGGSGNGFGNYTDTYYPGMGLSTVNGKINIMLEAWDRITYSELASMGVVSKSTMDKMNALYPRWTSEGKAAEIYDYNNKSSLDDKTYQEFCQGIDYSDYFNHHACGVGAGSGYMSGGWRVCNYHYNTMGSIIGKIANEAGPTWGPAHEIGHQHQAVFNLNGQTEVTNNFFSNVAVWYMGMGTSRVNGSEGSLESVLAAFNTENNDLYTNNIWAITHMYYRLWLYYHLAGNNTQFWPRLFELCRREPLVNGGQISGETSLLRFYKHACNAAGEDLTEFFRAHGFFEVMDNRLVGDYSNATYNVTQEQIDAAITEIKGKKYPANYAVLLINDGTSETTKMHDGSASRALWDNNATAEFGSVNDFIDGDIDVLTNYVATVNADGSITMNGGDGGAGFLIFNENGELVAFSNKPTFNLGDEALETIVSGKATIATVDTENNVTNAEVDITAMQRATLEQLVAKVQPIVDKIDDTYTKIGFFKGTAVADLASALAYAKEVCAASSGFEAAYDLLYAEYTKVLENSDSKIPFNPSLTYIITNYGNPNQTMWVNSENTVRSEGGVDQSSNDARWEFVETATAGVYNIRTLNNDYIPAVQQSASMTATSGQPDSNALYTLEEVKDGVWAIKLSPAAGYRNLHSSWNNVVGWETGADASRWYLTAVAADPVIADLTDLEVYINKTELLLDEVLGSVTYTKGTALALQTTNQGGAYYLSSNAPSSKEGSIGNLVDGATNNYFHTDYTSEPTSGSHYLTVYLGEDNTLSRFTFSHTTRSGASSDFPKSVDVYGSNDGTNYKFIASASGMPQSAGAAWEFDGVMLSSYKYLRFNYHANRGYWHMAEFDITPITGFTATVNETYSSTVGVDAVTTAMNALLEGKLVANGMSPTTGDVAAKLAALQTAYNALYGRYESTINARKSALATLAAQTETLINEVGEVQFALNKKLTLTTENLYCNAPYTAQNNSDYSAAYVDKLTDGSKTTYLHTDYSGTVAAPHYLRVDLGSGSTATKFKFNYSTRDNGNNCPTIIVIEGSDEADGTYTEIKTLTCANDGLPNPGQNTNGGVAEDFESSVITMSKAYRYVRFKVTGVEGGGATFFVISEFGLNIIEDNVTVNNTYKGRVSNDLLLTTALVTNSSKAMSANELVTDVPMLDAQILDQQTAYDALNAAMQAVPDVDKTALQELYDAALPLYEKMTDDNGDVDANYTPSALTLDMLTSAKTALDVAKSALDNATSQEVIDDARTSLQVQYEALLVVENANVATTIDKSSMNTAISDAQDLIAEINANLGYYESVAGLGLVDLGIALQNAQAVVDRFYLTEAQYNDALATLNTCLSATQTVVNADCADRTTLTKAIENANTLLSAIAAKGEGYYSAVTDLGADELRTALQNAQGVVDKYHTTEQCAFLLEQLNTCLSATQTLVNADCADRTALTTAIENANTLLSAIAAKDEGYYSVVANLGTDELRTALQNAQDVVDKYHTTEQCASLLEQLNTCLLATQAVVDADCADRTALAAAIENVNMLLSTIADEGENNVALPLQATAADAPFYIWCNAPAGDSNGVAGLIDKNADGTANTDTFLGTEWGGGEVPAYTHYIEIDLGTENTMGCLSMDYTTRNSTHANQRPNAIKILGSNDKENYTPIIEIIDDFANNANEKWNMDESLDLGAYYRYIRIAVGTEKGFFHMSDFNLYTTLSHTLKEYYTTAEELDFIALCLALCEAEDALACYLTTEQYDAVYAKLNNIYAVANDIVKNDYTDRDALAGLVADATTLVTSAVSVNETETVLALQSTDENAPYYIYCNAPGATNNYSGDNLGAAALLDVDDNGEPITATFLHTSYVTGSHDDDLDHYLRVDMGKEMAVETFKFRYTPRIGNTGNAPLVMLIEGSNDCVNFEEITTLSDMATTYQSSAITNGKAYRYIRFMVKDTHNHSAYDGHKFFAMSHFEMTACKTIAVSEEYVSPNLPLNVAADAYNALADAGIFDANHYLANETGSALKENLQAACDALNASLLLKNIPVILTTDTNNPVLYKIKINRDGDKRLHYDVASSMVAVNDVESLRNQAWYFMSGDDATVLIIPYKDENKFLATNSFSEGNSKVKAVAAGTEGYSYNWNITKVENSEWYNITILDRNETTYYFSNHGGVGNKMGFYNHSDDAGSQFQFVLDSTDYSIPDSYYELLTLHHECGAEKTAGNKIGQYTEETASAFNNAKAEAETMLADTKKTADEYAEMCTRLQNAFDALEVNMPVEGVLYRIRSANTNAYSNGKLVYVNSENKPHFAAAQDENLSNYIWQFEVDGDGYSLKNLHTQTYVKSAPWAAQVVLDATPTKLTIDVLDNGLNGEVRMNVSGSNPLHAQDYGSMLVGYTGDAGSASAWYIEKVTNDAAVHYPYTLTSVGYGTLMLGFDTKVPEGVTAYWAECMNEESIELRDIAETIPANTAVILKRNSDNAEELALDFAYNSTQGAELDGDNMLDGTLYKTVVACGNGNRAYVMQAKNGVAKMYWAYANINADGTKNENAGGQNDEGGHIMNSANRAYLVVSQVQMQPSIFNLRFGFGSTTELDEVRVNDVKNDVIYDLQGRKLDGIARSGFYIVNGKKMLVK